MHPAPVLLRRWARATLGGIGESGKLCIRIVDTDEMAELNARYRHKAGRDQRAVVSRRCRTNPTAASDCSGTS